MQTNNPDPPSNSDEEANLRRLRERHGSDLLKHGLRGMAHWLFSIRSWSRSGSNRVLVRVSWPMSGHEGRASW
jgi:hypothetical protein